MPSDSFAYKQDHPMDKRSAEAARIREKYPDRIPVICEKDPRSDIPPVDKRKYLIPMDLTVGQFVYVIRKRISIPSDKVRSAAGSCTISPSATTHTLISHQRVPFLCERRRSSSLSTTPSRRPPPSCRPSTSSTATRCAPPHATLYHTHAPPHLSNTSHL